MDADWEAIGRLPLTDLRVHGSLVLPPRRTTLSRQELSEYFGRKVAANIERAEHLELVDKEITVLPRYLKLVLNTYCELSNLDVANVMAMTLDWVVEAAGPFDGTVEWSDDKHRTHKVAWSRFRWRDIAEHSRAVSYLSIGAFLGGPDVLSGVDAVGVTFHRRFEPGELSVVDIMLRKGQSGKRLPPELQSGLAELGTKLFDEISAVTGYLTLDRVAASSVSSSSPYEHVSGQLPRDIVPRLSELARGYYWGNFLSASHVERLGGAKALEAAPVVKRQPLGSSGQYLQLTRDINDISREELAALRAFLKPVLPPPTERASVMPNRFDLVLDEGSSSANETPAMPVTTNEELERQMAQLVRLTQGDLAGLVAQSPEAVGWINDNAAASPLAGNRFDGRESALKFVEQLYALGAVRVVVGMIMDEAWRIEREGGPYATGLVVQLPQDRTARRRLMDLYLAEARAEIVEPIADPRAEEIPDYLWFGWD